MVALKFDIARNLTPEHMFENLTKVKFRRHTSKQKRTVIHHPLLELLLLANKSLTAVGKRLFLLGWCRAYAANP